MRLIDVDKLKAHYAWWAGGTRTMTMDEAKSDFDVIVDLQPTIEAEPKHGRWVKDEDGVTVCSKCGEVALQRLKVHLPDWVTTFDAVESNYCPNCGSAMGVEK